MEDLLQHGPYEMKELTEKQKQALYDEFFCEWDYQEGFSFDQPWYVSNDPMLDQEWDGRDDFWARGEEYPYPYVILIGGKTVEYQVESITKESANRLGIFLSR